MSSKIGIILGIFALFVGSAHGDIEWEGTYRFEGLMAQNPELAKENTETKAYMLHHLVLRPKITAYDGLTIHGRFDILNTDSTQFPQYQNSQLGDFVGSGVNDGSPSNATDSNVLSDNQRSSMINVNELYMTYSHEFGLLTVGRAPIHFGLGMSYNNGRGEFDHWFDNRDMVAYKIVTGNLSFMPAIAKLSEGDLNTADDVDDYMIEVMYENPATELTLGLLYRRRHASFTGNDLPAGVFGGAPTTSFGGEFYNFFFSRYITDTIHIGVEGGVQSGDTGVGGELDGLGIALELEYKPMKSSFEWYFRGGMASGDDPTTTNTFEGFAFDRNYDVAMLLFNHPMGQYDIFTTSSQRDTTQAASALVDEESLSNVLYLAPAMKYKWSETLDVDLSLTYAQLNTEPISGVDKDVGYELDISVDYRPYKGVRWLNRAGIFIPGAAFEGGNTNNFGTETVFGIETKAAITF